MLLFRLGCSNDCCSLASLPLSSSQRRSLWPRQCFWTQHAAVARDAIAASCGQVASSPSVDNIFMVTKCDQCLSTFSVNLTNRQPGLGLHKRGTSMMGFNMSSTAGPQRAVQSQQIGMCALPSASSAQQRPAGNRRLCTGCHA